MRVFIPNNLANMIFSHWQSVSNCHNRTQAIQGALRCFLRDHKIPTPLGLENNIPKETTTEESVDYDVSNILEDIAKDL